MNSNVKTALITGAGKRIGAAIAHDLAARGWRLIVHYNRSGKEAEALADEIRQAGGWAMSFGQDLQALDQLEPWFLEAIGQAGPINLLVHNASLFHKDNLHDLDSQKMEIQIRVNGLAPLILNRAFQKQCPGNGNIICLLDGMKGWSYSANYLSYSLSKNLLAESITLLADQLAPTIRINGIGLGATLAGAEDEPTTFTKLRQLVPLKRNSSPEEVCCAIQFLLDAPSMTGEILDISGGMNILRHYKTSS